MREFLESAGEIEKNIETLRKYTNDLKRFLRIKQSTILREEEESELERKISATNDLVKEVGDKTRAQIRKNQEKTIELIKKNERKSYIAMREQRTTMHAKSLSEALKDFRNLQAEHSAREKEKLKETFMIAKPNATEEELEALEDREEGDALLASVFALGSHSAQGVLIQAKNRKKKIDEIASLINTLVSLIDEIDKMVRKQSPAVDHITVNMTSAEAHTAEANRQLESALGYQRAINRWKKILLFGLFIILVIAILIFFPAIRNLIPWNFSDSKKS